MATATGGLEFRVEGLDDLLQKLQEDKLLGQAVRRFLERATLVVERRVKTYSPVDTDRMRASMTTAMDAAPTPLWGSVGTNVYYAPFVEYGRGNPRRTGRIPFMRPALEDSRAEIDDMADRTIAEIERDWGK